MTDEERVGLIRRGNELYNRGDIKDALKIYLATNYIDGIIRVADRLFYEEKNMVAGIKLYKKAGYTHKVAEFAEKAAFTIQMWLAEDKDRPQIETEVAEKALEAVPYQFPKIEQVVKVETGALSRAIGSRNAQSNSSPSENNNKDASV